MARATVIVFAALVAFCVWVVPALGQGGGRGQQPAPGTFTASSTAPGGKNNAEVEVDQSGAGALTVTRVSVNGTVLSTPTDYTVSDNGTSSPTVQFNSAVTPPAGASVVISGTTASGGINFTAGTTWS